MKHYYTDEENAQIVIALLKAHGIRKVIASPGTTNMPLTGSLPHDPHFEVYSSADERSAAYMACGLSYESGEPVVLSCTGATASRNYLPGLTEAWYRKLPVVAITSGPSLVEVGHLLPQCIDRSVIPKDVARISVALPPIKDKNDRWDCEVKVNKALLEARRSGGGPVHINLVTSFAGTYYTRELPAVRVIRRIGYPDPIPTIDASVKVVVFIGSHKPFSNTETEAIEQFVATHNAVVLCDHTGSYRGAGRVLSPLACHQAILKRPHCAILKPDLIIDLGEVSADVETQELLRSSRAKVWRVSEDGEVRDRFKRLQYVFEMREQDFFRSVSENATPHENGFLVAWREYAERIAGLVPDLPFSNAWIAQELSRALPPNAAIHLGIQNSVRFWNCCEVEASVQAASNVGGFGIDGCVSTLIGASLGRTDRLYFGVFGDLAFFYDLNVLGNRHLSKNVRIVLINNGGGGEFKLIRHSASQFGEQADDYIAAAGHYGNKSATLVKNIAQALGFKYLCARSKDEFKLAAREFTAASMLDKPLLLECFTEFRDDANALEAMENLDTTYTTKSLFVTTAGRVLPKRVRRVIKKRLEQMR
jgi:2-succinyl-5-enolpyruvyl-6-hydroxy-3-cyclohexene-1-carboxylate synthase